MNCQKKRILSRGLSSSKLESIKNLVGSYPFKSLEVLTDVNQRWLSFKVGILEILDKVAPLKSVVVKNNFSNVWYDHELVQLSRKRNRAFKKALRDKSAVNWSSFQTLRNLFSKRFREKKKLYFSDLLSQNLSKRDVWCKLRPFLSPKTDQASFDGMLIDGSICRSKSIIVNEFANYFSCLDFLNFGLCRINSLRFISVIFNKFFGFLSFRQRFEFSAISSNEVLKLLQSMDSSCSPGFCGIPSILLKTCAAEISDPLSSLFNLCLYNQVIPEDWKIAIVKPLYKGKGSKIEFDSYRPISILAPINKIFEACIAERIRFYFESNNLFCDQQFGFRKLRSCELV